MVPMPEPESLALPTSNGPGGCERGVSGRREKWHGQETAEPMGLLSLTASEGRRAEGDQGHGRGEGEEVHRHGAEAETRRAATTGLPLQLPGGHHLQVARLLLLPDRRLRLPGPQRPLTDLGVETCPPAVSRPGPLES